MTLQSLPWHPPTIVDLGIHVPPKKNTWPTFFGIISKHFTSHQTFPIAYPKVELIKTSIIKNRLGSRERMRELRARRRTKEHKRDPVEFRQVPLPRSVINRLASGLKIKRADDKPVTDKEWQRGIDLLIASIVTKSVIRK